MRSGEAGNSSSTPQQLLFVTGYELKRHVPVYRAIDLAETLPSNWEEGWDGFVAGQGEELARVVRPVSHISHASTSRGSVWLEDGKEIPRLTDDQWLAAVSAPRTSIALSPPRLLAVPAFISSDAGLKPFRFDLVVRLLVKYFADLPDVRCHFKQSDTWFSPQNEAVVEHRASAGSTVLFAPLDLPVEVGSDGGEVRGVLRLEERIDDLCFRGTLYHGSEARVRAGSVLRRRAAYVMRYQSFTFEADVAEVVEASAPRALATEFKESKRGESEFPVICLSCGVVFEASRFSLEEREVIGYWADYHRLLEERLMLDKVARMFERHPEARGRLITPFQAVMNSKNQKVMRRLAEGAAFSELVRPREEYDRRLWQWVEGDRQLFDFLQSTSCDFERRLGWAREQCAEWQGRLRGRKVDCPECGRGVLALNVPE